MKLTPEESRKIDEALAALGRNLKDELEAIPAASRAGMKTDDAFLKNISETYLSGAGQGILALLLDSGILAAQPRCGSYQGCSPSQSCTCGVTCAQPSSGTCTGVSR